MQMLNLLEKNQNKRVFRLVETILQFEICHFTPKKAKSKRIGI